MENNGNSHMPFIHPSRAHLFKKPPIPDKAFKHTSVKQVSQTWNNRRDRSKDKDADDQLLVFGYASKLFPPDDHSSSIAKNKHLIAWNEDYKLNLLIDRYDCRASLHSLSEFDPNNWNKTYQLSDEELKLEKHLDEERYRALFVEELEEDIRHEEELKRLHASIASDQDGDGYGEVGYDYDDTAEQYDPTEPTNDEEDDQKLFIAPSSLAVPKDMEIPATEKMHAIIEKTAMFVSKQGAQMEIVLKAKQANNSQFLFLQFDHYLNPYYKHMVKRIKEGKYSPGISEENEDTEDKSSEDDEDDGDGGYLHPSLFASSHKQAKPEHEEKTKAIRTVDPDHPLAKLIERGRQANAIKQYQRMAEAVMQYYQQGSYDSQTTSSSLEPPPLPSFMTMAGLHSTPQVSSVNQLRYSYPLTMAPPGDESQQQAALLNASVSEIGWRSDAPIVPPPPDLQEVVEEIARKVAMEGKETEKALICQADVDYSFLNPWHELHPYYQFRKMSWLQILHPPPPPQDVKQDDPVEEEKKEESNSEEDDEDNVSQDGSSKTSTAPISFSIKARKEGLKKPVSLASTSATAVLGEDPSDEEIEQIEPKTVEPKKLKPTRRRFTDRPPESTIPAVNQTIPEAVLDTNSSDTPIVKTDAEPFPTKAPSPPSSAPTVPISSFTAVTSTGEAASISELREKQAERRRKALLFLKSKAQSQEESTEKKADKMDEQSRLAAVASEDIFDLSAAVEESQSAEESSENTAEEHLVASSVIHPVLQPNVLSSSSSSSVSSSSESFHASKKRSSRTRSRSRSKSRPTRSAEHNSKSRDYSRSKLIRREMELLLQRTKAISSSSSNDDVPSAYRVKDYRRELDVRIASALKRTRKRSHEGDLKRFKHSRRERSSNRSNKHKRSSKRTSHDKHKKKKRKKAKKVKRSKKKVYSSSSSSSDGDDDDNDDEINEDETNENQEIEEVINDDVRNIVFEVKNNNYNQSTGVDVTNVKSDQDEISDGEIISE